MKKSSLLRLIAGLSFAALAWSAATQPAHGQFTQNRDTIKVDSTGYPADIQKDYKLFRTKCNECHGLDKSLKLTLAPAQWTAEVKRMRSMASSQINDKQATAIIAFLNYYEAHRKAPDKPVAAAATSSASSPGRQFYEAQNCDTCHSIAGKGGSVGPSLTDVGKRLSREKLTEVIQGLRVENPKSTMPPLPAGTTDQQVKDLIDFLSSLREE